MEANPKINDFMTNLTRDEIDIVEYLTKNACQLAVDVAEDIKWNALCFFKGDRPFVGIMPYKKYISLIFDRGAELDDPYNVLEGKGHTMRHIKIHSFDDLARKHVSSYIEQSYKL